MNKSQLISMWCGIAAIVLAGFAVIQDYGLVSAFGFPVWVLIVALITGGLICTLKSSDLKKKEQEKEREKVREKEQEKDREKDLEREKEKEKEKNKIQDIRGTILKRKQFKMKRDSQSKDN